MDKECGQLIKMRAIYDPLNTTSSNPWKQNLSQNDQQNSSSLEEFEPFIWIISTSENI